MGLKWSKAKKISDGTKLFMMSPFPKDIPNKFVWFVWKEFKMSVKADGFGLKKYKDTWYITYTTKIDDDTFDDVETDSGDEIKRWHRDRNEIVEKWSAPLDAMVEIWAPFDNTIAHKPKSEADEIDDFMAEMADDLE